MTTITIKIKTDAGASVTVSEETHVLHVPSDVQAPQNGSEEAQDPYEGEAGLPAPETVDLSDWEESGLGEQPRHTFLVGDLVRITQDPTFWTSRNGRKVYCRKQPPIGTICRLTHAYSDGIDFDFVAVDDPGNNGVMTVHECAEPYVVKQPDLPVVQVTFLLPDTYLDTGDDIIAEEVSRRLEQIAFEYGAHVHDVTVRR